MGMGQHGGPGVLAPRGPVWARMPPVQALILAAGRGLRLGELTRDRTKAMVEVAGRTLIARALDALDAAGVEEVAIVIGHAGEHLRDFVGRSHGRMRISYIENPVFDRTNNIYSLWLAREFLARADTLLLESDLVFEPRLIRDLLADPRPDLAVVAKFESWMDGTVTLLDADDSIAGLVSKEVFDWSQIARYYKTVNVYKFSAEFSRRIYLPFLEAYIRAFGEGHYYEQVLSVIAHVNKRALRAHRIEGLRWYEIDDRQDLSIAEALFADEKGRLELFQRRYGGYWRFPGLLDFCYLVNPYFPTPRLMEELRASFAERVTSYPSGQAVQDLLGAELLGCEPGTVVVGNGASELLRGLLPHLPRPVGRVIPGFEEYAAGLEEPRELKNLRTRSSDFGYGVDELVEFAQGLGTLVVVNPDNPTGHFLEPAQIEDLLQRLRGGPRVILDESFIDFAGDPAELSALRRGLTARYERLVIVKSLGKAYGVAGLRLGLLASADRSLVDPVRRTLPIWNINALAESFLQVVRKYRDDFTNACRRVAEERARMKGALADLPWLRVLPSRANFLLCEATSRYSATELTRRLLERHGILIKDCTGKPGLEHGQFVRIAIRTGEDNDRLLGALRAF